MSGIYIPGMEMPKKDEVISIYSDGTAYRRSLALRLPISKSKALPVPEHGRLIDADELNKKPKKCFRVQDGAFPKSEWFIRASDLFDAPAIIPASTADKEGKE